MTVKVGDQQLGFPKVKGTYIVSVSGSNSEQFSYWDGYNWSRAYDNDAITPSSVLDENGKLPDQRKLAANLEVLYFRTYSNDGASLVDMLKAAMPLPQVPVTNTTSKDKKWPVRKTSKK